VLSIQAGDDEKKETPDEKDGKKDEKKETPDEKAPQQLENPPGLAPPADPTAHPPWFALGFCDPRGTIGSASSTASSSMPTPSPMLVHYDHRTREMAERVEQSLQSVQQERLLELARYRQMLQNTGGLDVCEAEAMRELEALLGAEPKELPPALEEELARLAEARAGPAQPPVPPPSKSAAMGPRPPALPPPARLVLGGKGGSANTTGVPSKAQPGSRAPANTTGPLFGGAACHELILGGGKDALVDLTDPCPHGREECKGHTKGGQGKDHSKDRSKDKGSGKDKGAKKDKGAAKDKGGKGQKGKKKGRTYRWGAFVLRLACSPHYSSGISQDCMRLTTSLLKNVISKIILRPMPRWCDRCGMWTYKGKGKCDNPDCAPAYVVAESTVSSNRGVNIISVV